MHDRRTPYLRGHRARPSRARVRSRCRSSTPRQCPRPCTAAPPATEQDTVRKASYRKNTFTKFSAESIDLTKTQENKNEKTHHPDRQGLQRPHGVDQVAVRGLAVRGDHHARLAPSGPQLHFLSLDALDHLADVVAQRGLPGRRLLLKDLEKQARVNIMHIKKTYLGKNKKS